MTYIPSNKEEYVAAIQAEAGESLPAPSVVAKLIVSWKKTNEKKLQNQALKAEKKIATKEDKQKQLEKAREVKKAKSEESKAYLEALDTKIQASGRYLTGEQKKSIKRAYKQGISSAVIQQWLMDNSDRVPVLERTEKGQIRRKQVLPMPVLPGLQKKKKTSGKKTQSKKKQGDTVMLPVLQL